MDDYQNLDRFQDVLGQLPMLQTYTQITYFFPRPHEIPSEKIIHDLSNAVTTLRKAVPWMGSRIVNIGKGPGTSGEYKLVKCSPPNPAVDIRNLEGVAPAYEDFRKRKAPVSMIESKLLAPVAGFPVPFEDSDDSPAHAVRVQANFIQGGLLVTFAIQHNVADAGGFSGLINIVATAMRGEAIPSELLEVANRDRRNALVLLGDDEPMLDHSQHLRPPLTAQEPLASPGAASYHVFRFTVAKMALIKQMASRREGFDPAVPYISTDDAICAFYWKHWTRVRSRRHGPDTVSRFGRQIDGRRLAGLPPTYMGAMAYTVTCSMTFGEIIEAPLSTAASRLRKCLRQTSTLYHLRSFATFVAREPDKSKITYAGKFNPDVDIGSSSVLSYTGLFPAFGYLGRPEFIRRPPSVPFAGSLVMWPGNPAGDCDAIACLTGSDLEALRADVEWKSLVEHIG
ncbi:transferase family-domain-containing protein [Xylaria venustula]|nr:transferase family-domain-containing protein [Xylaria venustula]